MMPIPFSMSIDSFLFMGSLCQMDVGTRCVRVSHRFHRFTRMISCRLHAEGCHADFADFADCQLIYACSSVSLRLTKTDIHPLKSMEAEPGVRLPLYSYKNEFLTP